MGSSPEQVEAALKLLKTVPHAAPAEANRIKNEELPQHRVVLTRPFRLGRSQRRGGEPLRIHPGIENELVMKQKATEVEQRHFAGVTRGGCEPLKP